MRIRVLGLVAGCSAVIACFATPASATYPGRNGVIAYVTAKGGIRGINPDGRGDHWIIRGDAAGPSWSPNGKLLAYSLGERGIYAARADGSHKRRVIRCKEASSPSFAPSGKRIAFACHGSIRSVRLDGSHGLTLTPANGSDYPDYSPDGRWMSYLGPVDCPPGTIGGGGDCSSAFLMRPNGADSHSLHWAAPVYDWSPDATRLVFAGLRTTNTDGSDVRTVAALPVGGATFSPNGRRLVFGYRHELQTIPVNGGALHPIVTQRKPSGGAWQPLPR